MSLLISVRCRPILSIGLLPLLCLSIFFFKNSIDYNSHCNIVDNIIVPAIDSITVILLVKLLLLLFVVVYISEDSERLMVVNAAIGQKITTRPTIAPTTDNIDDNDKNNNATIIM